MSFIRGVGEATFSVGEFAHRRDVHEALWPSEWTVELVDCGAIVDRTAPGHQSGPWRVDCGASGPCSSCSSEWEPWRVDCGASGPWSSWSSE